MATATLGPCANSGSVISSGTDVSFTYSNVRAGTANLTLQQNSPTDYVAHSFFAGADENSWEFYECFLEFDTSFIGAAGSITSATLKLYVEGDGSATDFTIEARLRDYGLTLTTADWVAGASIAGVGSLAASISTFGIGGNGLKTLTNSGTVLATGINKTGRTRIMLATSTLRTGTSPTDAEYVGIFRPACVLEIDGTFNNLPAAITGSAAETVDAFVDAAFGTIPLTGTAAETVGAFVDAATGNVTAPPTSVVGVETMGVFVDAASGTFTPAAITGTVAETIGAFTGGAVEVVATFAAVSASGFTIVGVETVGVFIDEASGNVAASPVTGSAAETVDAFTDVAFGIFGTIGGGSSGPTGIGVETMGGFVDTASGTFVVPIPSVTGSASETMSAFVDAAYATLLNPPITGSAAQTIGAFVDLFAGYLGNYTVTPGREETLNNVGREELHLSGVETLNVTSAETLSTYASTVESVDSSEKVDQ